MSARGKILKRRKRRRRQVVPRPEPATPLAPSSRIRAWVATVLALTAFAASAWFFVLYPSGEGPGQGHAVEIVVPLDVTPGGLASILAQADLVSSPRLFAFWVRATGGTRRIVAGRHLLTDDASPRDLMARLERRLMRRRTRVTLPEGWTRFDIARRLQDKQVVALTDFLDATTDEAFLRELGIAGDSAEGFLFPATYDLELDGDPRDVVRTMKREFDRRWEALSRAHSPSLDDVMTSARLGVREIVTLASMIEKESAIDGDRAIVASVFLNRLRDSKFSPKRLECDPTAAYGCLVAPEKAASCAFFSGKPTASIEHDPNNPYSTYTHEGLPPGPIANPGAKSLEAAMSPATTHYFYFVARSDGKSTFSETLGEHTSAVHNGGRR